MDVVDPGSSGRPETDAVVEGPKWAGTTITFSFPGLAGYADYGSTDEVANNFEPFNPVQQAAVRTILAQISTFTGLSFVELTGAQAGDATLRFAMSDEPDTAYAYLPNASSFGGDVWVNNSTGWYDDPVVGNYAWFTLVHEIGHTLGLGHPHESTPPLDQWLDWMPFTVMSYRSTVTGDTSGGYNNEEWSFAQTFMREDIYALQFLYGPNYDFNSGNTVYEWNPETGELLVNGIGQGVPGANRVFSTVWDGGGIDTYDLSNYSNRTGGELVSIDLRPGGFIKLSNEQAPLVQGQNPPGNVGNALLFNNEPRSLIENAIGPSAGAIIFGNEVANHIVNPRGEAYGYGGDDWLEGVDGILDGGGGNDTLISESGILRGGEGNDRIISANALVYAGPGDDYVTSSFGRGSSTFGEDGNDHLEGGPGGDHFDGGNGNDLLEGFADNDELRGGPGDDRIFGGDGDDSLEGGPGSDYMEGGAGNDVFYFEQSDDQIVEYAGGGTDTVITSFDYIAPPEIENFVLSYDYTPALPVPARIGTGNASDNIIVGNYFDNVIDGGAGVDDMRGANGDDVYYVDNANDSVYERREQGFDIVITSVSYSLPDTPGESWNLPSFFGNDGLIMHSEPNEIELLRLVGADALNGTGNAWHNTLEGNALDNTLDGRNGDDTLIGHTGADTLIGGAGIDTASYAGDEGGVFVNLTLGRGYGNASFGDTYDSIENVIGTDYNDFIIGDPGVNRLDGAGGNDVIIGAVGADEIIGGAGLDWASYEDNSGVVFINLTLARGYNNAAEGDTYTGIENLIGGLMDDFFIGDDGPNRLNGAMGADTLLGAGGADIFMFTYAPGAESTWGNPNVDLILDFTTGVDKIELASSAFAGLSAGALPTGAFYAGTAAHDADDRIIYDNATGKLWFDPDGTGGQAAMLFATLGESSHPAAIAASDFVVV